jgi:putative redox protein
MKALIKHIQGVTFLAKADSNHWISIDGPQEFNGSEAGNRPKELLLIALGSCTASDVATILNKKHISLDHFEVEVVADVVDEHPKVFSKIHLTYHFYGENLKQKDLERAIDLSQNKYCPITIMMRKACEITHSYAVHNKEKD